MLVCELNLSDMPFKLIRCCSVNPPISYTLPFNVVVVPFGYQPTLMIFIEGMPSLGRLTLPAAALSFLQTVFCLSSANLMLLFVLSISIPAAFHCCSALFAANSAVAIPFLSLLFFAAFHDSVAAFFCITQLFWVFFWVFN